MYEECREMVNDIAKAADNMMDAQYIENFEGDITGWWRSDDLEFFKDLVFRQGALVHTDMVLMKTTVNNVTSNVQARLFLFNRCLVVCKDLSAGLDPIFFSLN